MGFDSVMDPSDNLGVNTALRYRASAARSSQVIELSERVSQLRKRLSQGETRASIRESLREIGSARSHPSVIPGDEGGVLSDDPPPDTVVVIEGQEDEKKSKKLPSVTAGMMLFAGSIGTGIFGLPLVLVQNGLVVGSVMLIIGGLFSAIGQYYLIKLVRIANERKTKAGKETIKSYSDLLQYAVSLTWPSKPSHWVNTFMNAVFVIYIWGGVIVTMTKFLCTFIDPALSKAPGFKKWIIKDDPTRVDDPNFEIIGILILFVIWLPLCLPADFSILRYISYYPLVTCFAALIFAIVMYCIEPTDMTNPLNIPDSTVLEVKFGDKDFYFFRYDVENLRVSTPLWRVWGHGIYALFALFLTSGRFAFAYMCHTNVVGIASQMADTTDKGVFASVTIAIVPAIFFYLLLSIFSFLTYGERLATVYVSSYPETTPSQVIRWFLAVMMIFGIPISFAPMRDAMFALIDDCTGYNNQQERLKAKQEQLIQDELRLLGDDANEFQSALEDHSTSAVGAPVNAVDDEKYPLLDKKIDVENEKIILPMRDRGFWWRFLITALLLFTGVMSAWLIPGVTIVMDYIGASFAPFLMVGGPAFMMYAILIKEYTGEPKIVLHWTPGASDASQKTFQESDGSLNDTGDKKNASFRKSGEKELLPSVSQFLEGTGADDALVKELEVAGALEGIESLPLPGAKTSKVPANEKGIRQSKLASVKIEEDPGKKLLGAVGTEYLHVDGALDGEMNDDLMKDLELAGALDGSQGLGISGVGQKISLSNKPSVKDDKKSLVEPTEDKNLPKLLDDPEVGSPRRESEGGSSRRNVIGMASLFYGLLLGYFVFSMIAFFMRIAQDIMKGAKVYTVFTPQKREAGNLRLYNDPAMIAAKTIPKPPFGDDNIEPISFSEAIDPKKKAEIQFWYENGPKARNYKLPTEDRKEWEKYDEEKVSEQYADFFKAAHKAKTGKDYQGGMLTKEVKWKDSWGGYVVDKKDRKEIDKIVTRIEIKEKGKKDTVKIMGSPDWLKDE